MKLKKLIWKTKLENLEIWFSGGIFWPLRTLWRILHILQGILKFSTEKKKNYLGKTVLNESQIFRKNCFENSTSFVPIGQQRLWMFLWFLVYSRFELLNIFLKALLWTHKLFFPQIWDHILKSSFPSPKIFSFYSKL